MFCQKKDHKTKGLEIEKARSYFHAALWTHREYEL